jgi:5-formyltetrahydrofolate cyclo-ligase
MGESYDQEKRRLRGRMEERRAALSTADADVRSRAACERAVALPAFLAARHVVAYVALGRELDPAMLIARARAAGKAVYLPRTRSSPPGFTAADGSALPADVTAVLFVVPGVAFDARGVRLGRGGGWYDRALAAYPGAVRLGLAYDFQVLDLLPEAAWDVRMHAVVTDVRVVGDPAPTGAAKETRTWN